MKRTNQRSSTNQIKKEVKPKRKRGNVMANFINLIRGLPEGPYQNRFSIVRELERYSEFRKPDGSKFTRQYLEILTKKAEELGYVKNSNGEKLINHVDGIVLTLMPTSASTQDRPRSTRVSADAKEQVTDTSTELERPPAPIKPVDNLSMAMLKSKLGFIERPRLLGTLNTVHKLLPQAYWDDMAQNSIAKRLRKAGVEPIKMPSEVFSKDEWFTLVWETLQSLPMSMVAPTFLEDLKFEDIRSTCRDCSKEFVFTISEQQFFQRIYGEVKTPASCKFCRKMKRAIGKTAL